MVRTIDALKTIFVWGKSSLLCDIPTGRQGRSRGYGIVEYAGVGEAQQAVNTLDGATPQPPLPVSIPHVYSESPPPPRSFFSPPRRHPPAATRLFFISWGFIGPEDQIVSAIRG